MNGPAHYSEAERLADQAIYLDASDAIFIIALAQVHATLAGVSRVPDQRSIRVAMHEYAACVRGDWSDFDGRSNSLVMNGFITALTGGQGHDWDIKRWRSELGLCPVGKGHWPGYCDESCLRDQPEQVTTS